MIRRFGLVASGLLALGGLAIAMAAGTFDGQPLAPLPFTQLNQSTYDVQVHSRDNWTWATLETQAAHHGSDCSGPPNVHTTSGSYDDAVFICRDHLMTAINATGYGVIYLTPNEMVDFSGGEAVIRWDMSTLRTSDRDWVDVWITPWADNMALPLESFLPDLTGEPNNAVHIRMDGTGTTGPLDGRFRLRVTQNGNTTDLGLGPNYNTWLTPDAARRDTFELRISATHVSLTMPGYGQTLIDSNLNLNFNKGVVQFGHHSYNPTKDGYTPDTWHWDNITASPSIPFTMIKANMRRDYGYGTFVFNAPAPAGSYLRFSGQGRIEINDGTGWRVVQPQKANTGGFAFASYFVPIATGAQTIDFRTSKGAGQWYSGPFNTKDWAIWSLTSASTPTLSPSNTATATSTNTPTATPTATSTPTPIPTPTATATVVCREAYYRDGVLTQGPIRACP